MMCDSAGEYEMMCCGADRSDRMHCMAAPGGNSYQKKQCK